MNDDDRLLWLNFSDALRRLLEHPDLTQAQRDFILSNINEEKTSNVIDIRHKRGKSEE